MSILAKNLIFVGVISPPFLWILFDSLVCLEDWHEEAQEAANTLTPGESDSWVLKEIRRL